MQKIQEEFQKVKSENKTRERKIWTEMEDKILRYLKEEKGEKKWSVIAKMMETDHAIFGRTGKQCRERYHNHLNSSIITSEWTREEEQILYAEQMDIGNKWSMIAQKLPGRSDNCVKNHFYSTLRRAVRRINKNILELQYREGRQITTTLLSKIIEMTELRFKSSSRIDEQLVDLCANIIKALFLYEIEPSPHELQNIELQKLLNQFDSLENILRKKESKSKKNKSVEKKSNFLHPSTCNQLNLKKSNSNISINSEISQSSVYSISQISNSNEIVEDEEYENRKRSRTTGNSDKHASFLNIQINFRQEKTRKSEGTHQLDDSFMIDQKDKKKHTKSNQSNKLASENQNQIDFLEEKENEDQKEKVQEKGETIEKEKEVKVIEMSNIYDNCNYFMRIFNPMASAFDDENELNEIFFDVQMEDQYECKYSSNN